MAPPLILLLYHKVSAQRFYLENRPGMPISLDSPLIPQEQDQTGLVPALSREILTDLQHYPSLRDCVFVTHWYDQKNRHFCVLVQNITAEPVVETPESSVSDITVQPAVETPGPRTSDSLFVTAVEEVTTPPWGESYEKLPVDITYCAATTTAEAITDLTTKANTEVASETTTEMDENAFIDNTLDHTSDEYLDSLFETNSPNCPKFPTFDMNRAKPYDPASEESNRVYADEVENKSAEWRDIMRCFELSRRDYTGKG